MSRDRETLFENSDSEEASALLVRLPNGVVGLLQVASRAEQRRRRLLGTFRNT